MMLKDILAISGKSGLFKIVSTGKEHLIVESLNDGKRTPIHNVSKVISLEDVAIYTEDDSTPMVAVFKNIRDKEDGKICSINPKKASSEEVKNYFEAIVPDYDKEQVYVSDMKKTLSWYNELVNKELLHLLDVKKEEENIKKEEQVAE